MSAQEPSHTGREGRRRSRSQPPRVMVAVTTMYGDPFLPTDVELLISWFRNAGAVAVTIGAPLAVAEFRLRASTPKRALTAVADWIPRPTAGTAFMFIATAVDGNKPRVLMSTDGWPDALSDVPGPEEAFYKWVSEDTDSWEVV